MAWCCTGKGKLNCSTLIRLISCIVALVTLVLSTGCAMIRRGGDMYRQGIGQPVTAYQSGGDGWNSTTTVTPVRGFGLFGIQNEPLPATLVEGVTTVQRSESIVSGNGYYRRSAQGTDRTFYYTADENGNEQVVVHTEVWRDNPQNTRWMPTPPTLNWHEDPNGPRNAYVDGVPVPLELQVVGKIVGGQSKKKH